MKEAPDRFVSRIYCVSQGAWWNLMESMFKGVAIYDKQTCKALPEQTVKAWAGQQRYAELLRGGRFVLRVKDSEADYWYEFGWSLKHGMDCDYRTVYTGPYREAESMVNPAMMVSKQETTNKESGSF